VDGSVDNGTGVPERPHEIVIACHSVVSGAAPSSSASPGSVSKVPPAAAVPVATVVPVATAATEPSVCVAAHGSVKEMAAYWSHLYPEAKPLAEPPAERDFVEVCRALPERVQRCLDAKQREGHEKSCLAVLRRLDPSEKNKVDSLFLE
jgi:hypothetical protein